MTEIKYIFHLGIVLGMSPIVLLLFILLMWFLFGLIYKNLRGKELADPPIWLVMTLTTILILVAAPLIAFGLTQAMGGLEALNQKNFTMHGRHTGSITISDQLGYILGGFGLLLYMAYLALLLWFIYDKLGHKLRVNKQIKQSKKSNDRPKILGDR